MGQCTYVLSTISRDEVPYCTAAVYHGGVVTNVLMQHTKFVVLFAVVIIQNKPSQMLQQIMQQWNLKQTTLQLFATRYLLGVQMGWPSLVRGIFAAALDLAPCSSHHSLTQGLSVVHSRHFKNFFLPLSHSSLIFFSIIACRGHGIAGGCSVIYIYIFFHILPVLRTGVSLHFLHFIPVYLAPYISADLKLD